MNKIITSLFSLFLSFSMYAQSSIAESSNVATSGTLTVSFTTQSAGGSYANKNVSAVWIENSAGTLINTMNYYTNNGSQSALDMSVWYGKIGSWTNRNAAKTTDGITGATSQSYGSRTLYWGKLAAIPSTVIDGTYTLKMELADEGGPAPVGATGHKLATYTFVKGPANSTGTLVGTLPACFFNVSIQWVPVATGINDVKLSNLYAIYPNPAKSNIFISGNDISNVEIFTLAGKSVFNTNEQSVNIEKLPKGTYFVKIIAANGSYMKKLVKE